MLKTDTELDEATRKRVTGRYEAARTVLQAAAESQRKAQAFTQLIATAPQRTQELGAQLTELDSMATNELATIPTELSGLGLDEVTPRLAAE